MLTTTEQNAAFEYGGRRPFTIGEKLGPGTTSKTPQAPELLQQQTVPKQAVFSSLLTWLSRQGTHPRTTSVPLWSRRSPAALSRGHLCSLEHPCSYVGRWGQGTCAHEACISPKSPNEDRTRWTTSSTRSFLTPAGRVQCIMALVTCKRFNASFV